MSTPKVIVGGVADALEKELTRMGFKRTGFDRFRRKRVDHEDRYILQSRTATKGGKRTVYICPIVHVFYPKVRKLENQLKNEKTSSGYPTAGGPLGLFTPDGQYADFPADSAADALLGWLDPEATSFWEALSTVQKVYDAYVDPDFYLPADEDLPATLAALRGCADDPEAAADELRKRVDDPALLETYLSRLEQ